MPEIHWAYSGLTGGTTGKLDDITPNEANEFAVALVGNNQQWYRSVASSESENSPWIIEPDAGGSYRWVWMPNSKPGEIDRPVFETGPTADDITINPGGYHLYGYGWVSWNDVLAYTFTGLAASTWRYLYIDYSSIAEDEGELAAGNFTEGGAPTWSDSRNGWYSGDDLCIMAVYGTSTSAYQDFWHDGGRLVIYDDITLTSRSSAALTTGWVDVTAVAPGFCTQVLEHMSLDYNSDTCNCYYRPNGSSMAASGYMLRVTVGDTRDRRLVEVATDDSQTYEVAGSTTGGNLACHTRGIYLPKGM
jgi:hypothetical protein